jgi:hypothetical protein
VTPLKSGPEQFQGNLAIERLSERKLNRKTPCRFQMEHRGREWLQADGDRSLLAASPEELPIASWAHVHNLRLHGLCKTISFPCEFYLVHSQRHTCAAQGNQKNPPSAQERKRSPAMYAVYFRKYRRTDFLLFVPPFALYMPPTASMPHAGA